MVDKVYEKDAQPHFLSGLCRLVGYLYTPTRFAKISTSDNIKDWPREEAAGALIGF